ncbi:YicC/YloC family endoribonuclease [Escherichia coli]
MQSAFRGRQADAKQLHINEELAKLIIDSANWVMKEAGQGQLNPVDVLRWPGVMAAAEQDMDAVATELLGGFDQTMEDFLASRASEGANLKALIEQRLEVQVEVKKVRVHLPQIIEWQRSV